MASGATDLVLSLRPQKFLFKGARYLRYLVLGRWVLDEDGVVIVRGLPVSLLPCPGTFESFCTASNRFASMSQGSVYI